MTALTARQRQAVRRYFNRPLPGGCADCNGFVVLRRTEGLKYAADTYHDDGCPVLSGAAEHQLAGDHDDR